MSTQLGIDDVCAGNPLAMQELSDMRDRIEELEKIISKMRWEAINIIGLAGTASK